MLYFFWLLPEISKLHTHCLHFLSHYCRLPVTLYCCRGRPVHWQGSQCSPARARQQQPSNSPHGQQGEQVQHLSPVNSWASSSTRWSERLARGPVRWLWWAGWGSAVKMEGTLHHPTSHWVPNKTDIQSCLKKPFSFPLWKLCYTAL